MKERPLSGIRVLEFAGIGPGPFCGMLLSDLGADVVRIDRPGVLQPGVGAITGRGRRSVSLDLKSDQGRETALSLVERTDALFEGFRPGVMERLGLGPAASLKINPSLVYGRITGWGQSGPLAQAAGHDINYIALAGALGSMGPADTQPSPPLNLVGDYAGGAMFMALGLVAGILRAKSSGEGQVIDAAMIDGTALLLSMFHDLKAVGMWQSKRGVNSLDGSAPYYRAYACADGEYITVGSVEPQFYRELLARLDLLDDPMFAVQMDTQKWPLMSARLAEIFASKPSHHWVALMEGTDICFAPMLSMDEAMSHEQFTDRETFVEFEGSLQPGAAPRFQDVDHRPLRAAPTAGEHNKEVLEEWMQ